MVEQTDDTPPKPALGRYGDDPSGQYLGLKAPTPHIIQHHAFS